MARPSQKQQQFAIYQDVNEETPTPQAYTSAASSDDAFRAPYSSYADDGSYEQHGEPDLREAVGEDNVFDAIDEIFDSANILPTDAETEDERRQSAVTSTSISSFPESSFEIDLDYSLSVHQPYSSPIMKQSFRRPDSVRRAQMSSPPPFERNSRRQILYSRSRTGTPRSGRASTKCSPLHRRHQTQLEPEGENRQYPLVLLHVTLLPVQLRWSLRSMEQILPTSVLENLQLLRSKVSETIAQRGILIAHPREEYDLLEERLLEALELKRELITKCGHFRARDSTSSMSSAEESVGSIDSGLGSSVEGDECNTCHRRVQSADSGVGKGKQKWSIKIFAANGLMRASAWTAAWSEMERVDVEILPWIRDDLRKQLDVRMMEEDADARREEEEARLRVVVEEQVRLAHEARLQKMWEEVESTVEVQEKLINDSLIDQECDTQLHSTKLDRGPEDDILRSSNSQLELSQRYRSKDIPLSLLLKNYAFLVARDPKNVLIIAVSILAIGLVLCTTLMTSTTSALDSMPPKSAVDIFSATETFPSMEPILDDSSTLLKKEKFHASQPEKENDQIEYKISRVDNDLLSESTKGERSIIDAGDGPVDNQETLHPDTMAEMSAVDLHNDVRVQKMGYSSSPSTSEIMMEASKLALEHTIITEEPSGRAFNSKSVETFWMLESSSKVCNNPLSPQTLFAGFIESSALG